MSSYVFLVFALFCRHGYGFDNQELFDRFYIDIRVITTLEQSLHHVLHLNHGRSVYEL